ncbi:copper resistance CopC/CopD family protein [Streptomyces sp. MAI_2237]
MARRQAGGSRHVVGAALAVVVALGWLLLAGAPSASAHAVLTDSAPGDGSVVRKPPKQVTATFDESIALVEDSMRVLDPDGRPVAAGDPHHAGGESNTAQVALDRGLGQGTYTVSWRVVSADSHAVSGAFTFSIGAPSATRASASPAPAVDAGVNTLYGIARFVAYAAVALLIGIALFVLSCWPTVTAVKVARRPFAVAWWSLTVDTLTLLLLRGPYDSGGGLTDALDPELWRRTMDSRPGIALLARLLLLLAAAVLLRLHPSEAKPARRSLVVGCLLCLMLATTWTAAEHAAAGIQVPLALASSILHLLAVAAWWGGLSTLLFALYRAPAENPLPAVAVARFSRLALLSVAVLAVTGIYQSWRGLGTWEAFSTPYGRILAFKIWAVLLMLLAASYSRRWTAQVRQVPAEERNLVAAGVGDGAAPDHFPVPRLPDGDGPTVLEASRLRLRRSVLAEAAVGVVVLVLTTVLTGTQTGRAAAESAAPVSRVPGQPDISLTLIPYDTGKNTLSGRGKVQVSLSPGRTGRNVVEALVYGADDSPVTIPELRLSFTDESREIGPLDAGLVDERGYWGSDTLNLPVSGTWTMKATVRVSEIDQVTVEKTVTIAR